MLAVTIARRRSPQEEGRMGENRFGLSRDIDEHTKRAIRQRCGFGCVMCGFAIVQYHHFDPPYCDATEHDPNGITLLCGVDHDRATRRILSDDVVRAANRNPWCARYKYTRDILFPGIGPFSVRIASGRFHCRTIAMFDAEVVFGISEPECRSAPRRLNAILTDPAGNEMLRIADNEWRVGVDRFDVRTSGASSKFATNREISY